jgi:hypothetical protein
MLHCLAAVLLQAASPAVVITHVTVIDVVAERAVPDQTVVIAGGRITRVGRARSTSIPGGARVIEGRGKYLIPGLWDMHVHLGMTGRSALPALVANGVTGVRDMGGSFTAVRAWRDSVNAGLLAGPRIVMTSPIIENGRWLGLVNQLGTQRGDTLLLRGMAERIAVSTDSEAIAAVDSIAKLGVPFIKLRNSPPPSAYFTLLREARRRGLKVVGHPPNPPIDLAAASDSGQVSLEHQLLTMRDGEWVSVLDTLSQEARDLLLMRLARNHTALAPTLVAGIGFRRTPDSVVLAAVADTAGLLDPRRRWVSADLAEHWRRQIEMKQVEGKQPDWNALGLQAAKHIHALDSAGVLILAGTDLGVPLAYPGFALHDELALLVHEGGLTPARALRAATYNAARFLGIAREQGIIKRGARADLVLLEANPLEDIANVGKIATVILRGRPYERGELERLVLRTAR